MESNKKKVLVYVHTDILGDALIKLPAVARLHDIFPEYEITWFAGCGPTVYKTHLNSLASNLIDVIKDDVVFGKSWKEFLSSCPINDYYDVIIDTQQKLLCTLSLLRITHGRFISPSLKFLLSDNKPKQLSDYYDVSLQERIMLLFNLAGNTSFEPKLDLNLSDEVTSVADGLLPDTDHYIGFAPGAGGDNKIWPLESFINVAKEQVDSGRTPVFFLGPKEQDIYLQVKEAIPEALFPEIHNKHEQVKGPLLAIALAKKLKLAVTNDAGIGHAIALSGCKTITLFGPSNSAKFISKYDKRIVIEASFFGSKEMTAIPMEVVKQTIEQHYN